MKQSLDNGQLKKSFHVFDFNLFYGSFKDRSVKTMEINPKLYARKRQTLKKVSHSYELEEGDKLCGICRDILSYDNALHLECNCLIYYDFLVSYIVINSGLPNLELSVQIIVFI